MPLFFIIQDHNYVVIFSFNTVKCLPLLFGKIFDSKRINWNGGTTFGALQIENRSFVLEEIKKRNFVIDWEVQSTTLFMAKEEALKLNFE